MHSASPGMRRDVRMYMSRICRSVVVSRRAIDRRASVTSIRHFSRRLMDCESWIGSSVKSPPTESYRCRLYRIPCLHPVHSFSMFRSVRSVCSLTTDDRRTDDATRCALVEQIICNAPRERRAPGSPCTGYRAARYRSARYRCPPRLHADEVSVPGSLGRLTYRCAGVFVSELTAAWNTDWSMTCCIITRSSRSLLLLLLPAANTDADEWTSRPRLQT